MDLTFFLHAAHGEEFSKRSFFLHAAHGEEFSKRCRRDRPWANWSPRILHQSRALTPNPSALTNVTVEVVCDLSLSTCKVQSGGFGPASATVLWRQSASKKGPPSHEILGGRQGSKFTRAILQSRMHKYQSWKKPFTCVIHCQTVSVWPGGAGYLRSRTLSRDNWPHIGAEQRRHDTNDNHCVAQHWWWLH